MLPGIGQMDHRFAGQPNDLASLRDIVLKGSRRLDVFLRRGERRIGKLGLEDTCIRVPEISLPGLFEHSVSPVVFFGIRPHSPVSLPGATDYSEEHIGRTRISSGVSS